MASLEVKGTQVLVKKAKGLHIGERKIINDVTIADTEPNNGEYCFGVVSVDKSDGYLIKEVYDKNDILVQRTYWGLDKEDFSPTDNSMSVTLKMHPTDAVGPYTPTDAHDCSINVGDNPTPTSSDYTSGKVKLIVAGLLSGLKLRSAKGADPAGTSDNAIEYEIKGDGVSSIIFSWKVIA